MAKTLIYYHRSYRKITGSGWLFLIELIAITLPLSLLFLFVYPLITEIISLFTQYVLSHYYALGTVKVIKQSFLLGDITFISIPGKYPSDLTALVNLIISLGLIILLPRLKKAKNIAIFFVFLAVVNLASAVFFILSPFDFPYTATKFSELYIKSVISMWLFLPFILGMAILLLPASIFPKLILIVLTLIYSIIFGTVRYILFLFIVTKYSIIYMALLFFAFGPLIDFVYIVGIYCYYNSRLAKNLKNSKTVWKWSY